MNWGVADVGLRKAPTDILPPDTITLDLRGEEDSILGRMRPKTRYNIGLSARRGVRVHQGGEKDLGTWQNLYNETARRNGIVAHGPQYLSRS